MTDPDNSSDNCPDNNIKNNTYNDVHKNVHINETETPCIGFVAKSGTGKTTLLEKVIGRFQSNGFRIAVIKHTHHDFEIDKPGKDSYRLRRAGAQQTLISGPNRWALMTENSNNNPVNDKNLSDLVMQLNHNDLDLVLVEGFKSDHYPKIELHRRELNQPHLFPKDQTIVAIATDADTLVECHLPLLDINNTEQICKYILDHFSIKRL